MITLWPKLGLHSSIVKHMMNSLSYEKMLAVLPLKKLFDAQQIIITGCGDSWLAEIAASQYLKKLQE